MFEPPESVVEAALVAQLVTGDQPYYLSVILKFDAASPLAVRAVFAANGAEVEWFLSRDVLAAGLTLQPGRTSGDGDVLVGRYGRKMRITLTSPDGSATVEVDLPRVESFIDATEVLVPLGAEEVDVDAFLAGIPELTS